MSNILEPVRVGNLGLNSIHLVEILATLVEILATLCPFRIITHFGCIVFAIFVVTFFVRQEKMWERSIRFRGMHFHHISPPPPPSALLSCALYILDAFLDCHGRGYGRTLNYIYQYSEDILLHKCIVCIC